MCFCDNKIIHIHTVKGLTWKPIRDLTNLKADCSVIILIVVNDTDWVLGISKFLTLYVEF